MSTLRVLVLAHHHGNWRVVSVDKLQLSNAARAIQASPPLGTRCITTTSQPGSALALARRASEMGLTSFFTKGAKNKAEPNATNLQCEAAAKVAIPVPEQPLPNCRPPTLSPPTATWMTCASFVSNKDLQLASGLGDETSDRDDSSQRRDSFRRPKGVRLTKILSINPRLSLEECLDSHHVIPRSFSGLPPFGTLHGQTEELDSPTSGTRLRSLSNFPYIVKKEQDMKARRERMWSEIEKKTSDLGKKAEHQAYCLHGGQDQIEEVQTLCDEFNDVYDHFESLIAELDDMIYQHGESVRCDSACQAATAALVENMAQHEKDVFETLGGNLLGNADDANSSEYEDNDGLAGDGVTDEDRCQSAQSLRSNSNDLIESTGSPARPNAPRSQSRVLSSPPSAKQVRWSDESDLGSSSSPPSSPPSMPTNNTPIKRTAKRPTSSRKDSKHTLQPTEANSGKSRIRFPERIDLT
ncbi:hypothetical protein HII31_05599 [Pseudocercospora fuligena]|uniref:Uncharacterized protein n=1 Tax=Pseudocercospora fuligena TaxID=685502 RepID=A0A8H6RKZ7_9PEZI|nr:hypothetical protein HII31_05599 [Pseudocercospora fuligena]